MAEKDTLFKNSIKYNGIFSFEDFYKFCYNWVTDQTGLDVSEDSYTEKIKENGKEIDIEWTCSKKLTDYFKFEMKIKFEIKMLKSIEVMQDSKKIKTNSGEVKATVKGILIKDYDGKFEKSAFTKFMRSIYEKWIIASRVEQFEEKIFGDCDEFLVQSRAWLDLEGKR